MNTPTLSLLGGIILRPMSSTRISKFPSIRLDPSCPQIAIWFHSLHCLSSLPNLLPTPLQVFWSINHLPPPQKNFCQHWNLFLRVNFGGNPNLDTFYCFCNLYSSFRSYLKDCYFTEDISKHPCWLGLPGMNFHNIIYSYKVKDLLYLSKESYHKIFHNIDNKAIIQLFV